MYRTKINRVLSHIQSSSYDWKLLATVIALVSGGLAFLSSGLTVDGDLFGEFFKQLLFGVWIGGVLAFILAKTDYHKLLKRNRFFFWVTFGLLAYVFLPILVGGFLSLFTSIEKNQVADFLTFMPIYPFSDQLGVAFRWVNVFGLISVQPSEIAKISLLIMFAHYLNKEKEFTYQNYKKPIWALAACAFLIVLQPDLGTIVVIFAIILSSLFVAKVKVAKLFSYMILPVVLFAGIFIFAEEYRRIRVLVWVSKSICSDTSDNYVCNKLPTQEISSDDEFQVNQVRKAVSSGGVFGVGYGQSELKEGVPELTTDGIVSVIAAEGGFAAVVIMLILYLYLFHRGVEIAKNSPDVAGRVLATGISVWILIQALWNLTGMTGYMPMKGLPLPFISEGGTAMLLNLAAIGILLNISSQGLNRSSLNKFKKKGLPKRKKLA